MSIRWNQEVTKYLFSLALCFTALLASSTFHYWLEQDISRTYYLFFYGFLCMFLGGLLLLRWSNVESGAQLASRLNKDNNAEKEDQDSLKYGSMVMISSVSLVFFLL